MIDAKKIASIGKQVDAFQTDKPHAVKCVM
jgi:hypothetical protein